MGERIDALAPQFNGVGEMPRNERPDSPSPRSRPARPPAPRPAVEAPRTPPRSDDDTAIVPPPDARVFASGYAAQASRRGDRTGLFGRRTMIPVLLTCGVMLPALAAMWFGLDDDSPLKFGGEKWLPITLIGVGSVMLALAVIDMLQVRHMLRAARDPRPARPR